MRKITIIITIETDSKVSNRDFSDCIEQALYDNPEVISYETSIQKET